MTSQVEMDGLSSFLDAACKCSQTFALYVPLIVGVLHLLRVNQISQVPAECSRWTLVRHFDVLIRVNSEETLLRAVYPYLSQGVPVPRPFSLHFYLSFKAQNEHAKKKRRQYVATIAGNYAQVQLDDHAFTRLVKRIEL